MVYLRRFVVPLLVATAAGVVLGELSEEALRLATAGRYIVTLKPDAGIDLDLHARWVSDIHARNLRSRSGNTAGLESTFSFPGFTGYTGAFDDATLEAIKANVNVS